MKRGRRLWKVPAWREADSRNSGAGAELLANFATSRVREKVGEATKAGVGARHPGDALVFQS
jgi:hypothetical protein